MKIAITAGDEGFLYRFRRELIEKLVLLGHEVVLIYPVNNKADHFAEIGCSIIDLPFNRRGKNPIEDIRLYQRYKRIFRQIAPDRVLTFMIKPNVYAGAAAAKLRIPYVVGLGGLGDMFLEKGPMRFLATVLYRWGARKAAKVIFENQSDSDTFKKLKIRPNQHLVVSGSGVNLDEFRYVPYPTNQRIKVLYLGRIKREKGIDELLEVAEMLHENGENFSFELAGVFEGPYEKQVIDLAKRGVISYTGLLDDVRNAIAEADVLVLPSYTEGMANVLLEAAALGRPVLASDIPGCREALVEGSSGLLFAPRSSQALADAIRRFAEISRDERELMGRRGRQHVEENFNRREVVSNYVDEISTAEISLAQINAIIAKD